MSVCLPALDEEATIGPICAAVRRTLMPELVDELVVIDSGSSDATAAVAAAMDATVHHVDDIVPRLQRGGKGEALWKSLGVARGDIVVWIDSDIHDFDPAFVSRLVAPLLAEPDLVMTKGYYRRPLAIGDGAYIEGGGGRVTELALRPLLNLLHPELSSIIQPLSGEYAIRTQVARELPFFSGYGVDIGLLMDVVNRHGLAAVRQVDLGVRVHENRSIGALGQTAFEVLAAFIARSSDEGRLTLHRPMADQLRQFDANHRPLVSRLDVIELPPRVSIDPVVRGPGPVLEEHAPSVEAVA
ncbi:MAG: glucosyl-3-phosphoglycerate synthase [Actinomycetota bacterium]